MVRQKPGDMTDHLKMPLVAYLGEGACKFPKPALLGQRLASGVVIDALVEVADRRVQRLRDVPQPADREAINALLALIKLLTAYADHLGDLRLCETVCDPESTNLRGDMVIDRCAAFPLSH
jgi:hypothetical protein